MGDFSICLANPESIYVEPDLNLVRDKFSVEFNTGTAIIQYSHELSALLNYNVRTPSCQPILMTHKCSKPYIQLYGS